MRRLWIECLCLWKNAVDKAPDCPVATTLRVCIATKVRPKILPTAPCSAPRVLKSVPRVETQSKPPKQTTQRQFFVARFASRPRACPARSESHKKSMPCSAPKILKTLQRVESPKTIGTCTMFPCFAKAKQFFGQFCNHPFNRICGFKRNLFSLTFILQLLQGKNQINFDTIFKNLIKILKLCRLNIFKGAGGENRQSLFPAFYPDLEGRDALKFAAPKRAGRKRANGGKPRGRPK